MRLRMVVVTVCWCRSDCGTASEAVKYRRRAHCGMRVVGNHIEVTMSSIHPESV
jgi:hypothetical protein